MRERQTRSSMRRTKKTKNHFREANVTQPKIAFKEVVATQHDNPFKIRDERGNFVRNRKIAPQCNLQKLEFKQMRARHTRSPMRRTKKTKNHFREANIRRTRNPLAQFTKRK